ncbi:helix-turn-helix domain-containing protein [Paenibacillus sp. GCM10027626]|uniref:helix-turn-helix domain-containing protein n=1 Tax=Paenibacillus sp. GCM10027626 TaxID=3273411 RepID=UPI00362FC08C
MSKISIIVGERIRTLRHQRGLSQEKLAFKADITPSYMGQVERGERGATIDTLEKVAVSLDITLEELFRFEDGDTTENDDFSIPQKIAFQLHGRTIAEQEAIYHLVKQILSFRDQK